MNKLQILAVSTPTASGWASRIATGEPQEITVAHSDEIAIERLYQRTFDIVLAHADIKSVNPSKLQAILSAHYPDTLFLEYQGESAEALDTKINAARNARKQKRIRNIRITDAIDAWKVYL